MYADLSGDDDMDMDDAVTAHEVSLPSTDYVPIVFDANQHKRKQVNAS